jgi:hypothetical protein
MNPKLQCSQCGAKVLPADKWTQDAQGNWHLLRLEAWPLYWRDMGTHREEFCSCECGVRWMQNKGLL